ncbi:hypothetical protein H0H92_002951 [Tricholoma furcatifolium]|nr:hypothetical protein H0H92_002951 [Tricholoma furcatifolium]
MTGVTELPLEMKAHIASYCSPSALAALALVQRALQGEAERTLYATIIIDVRSLESYKGILETLAGNHKKAFYVRFLQFDAFMNCRSPSVNEIAAKALISILPSLVSLKDLRMKLGLRKESFKKELNDMFKLKSQHLQLDSLFCNDWFDIPELVKSQRSLWLLGTYVTGHLTLQALEQLRTESVPLPLAFCSEREGFIVQENCIGLFPAFLPPGTHLTIFQTLKTMFARDHGVSELTCDGVNEVSLFFETLCDTKYIAEFIFGATEVFPNISDLILLGKTAVQLV